MNSVYGNILNYAQTNGSTSVSNTTFIIYYGVLLLCTIAGGTVLSAMVYALMQTYERRDGRLVDLQWNDFKEPLIRNAKRSLHLFVFLTVVFVAIAFLVGIFMAIIFAFSGWSSSLISLIIVIAMMFLIFFVLLVAILFAIMYPVYIFEPGLGLFSAIGKAWKFGFASFWSLLGFTIVIAIIASVLQTVTTMPWYIVTVVGSLFSIHSDPPLTQSIFYKFTIFIFGIVQSMGSYISSIIMLTGIAFQYFHLREKYEGVTIESNITNFGEL
jgi:hypothetical protein